MLAAATMRGSQRQVQVPIETPKYDNDPVKVDRVVRDNIKKDNFVGHSDRSCKHLRASCDYPDCTKTLRHIDSFLAYKGETYCQKHRFEMMKWIMSEQQAKIK